MMNTAHSVWRQYTGDRDGAVLFFVKVVVALCSHSSPLLVATIDNMTTQCMKVKDYFVLSFEGLRA